MAQAADCRAAEINVVRVAMEDIWKPLVADEIAKLKQEAQASR